MTEIVFLFVAVLLVVACGLFVAAEFSLTTVDRGSVERAAAAGERGAPGVLKAVRRLTFQLSGAQLGITVTSLVIGMLAQDSLATLLAGPLRDLGMSDGPAHSLALVLGIGISTVFLMVFGELVPKNWAISHPLAVAKTVAGPQRAFTAVFTPLIGHLNSTANLAVRRLGMEPAEELASARSPQELVALARHSAAAGTLDTDAADLFARAVTLGELSTEQIMTPRVRVHGLRTEATAADVVNLTRATGHSRFPVYLDSLDDVHGVVHLKHALAVPVAERADRTVGDLAPAPILVPTTLPVDELLDLLGGRETMAIVVDEHGGTAGVVTLEDIIEEVVGEVIDEHDAGERPELVDDGYDAQGHARWDIDGGYRLDQIRDLGLDAPDGPYETVAGLIADRLSRIPETGDAVVVEGWTLIVTEVDHHRAERVRLVAPVADDTEDDDA